jgi:transcriptional regulator with XRE-family HTH domain
MSKPSDDPEGHFAERIARLQRDLGLSDEVLAARAKLSPDELVRILRGQGPIPLDTVLLLAGTLGVEPGKLLGGIAWVPDGKGEGEYRPSDRDA